MLLQNFQQFLKNSECLRREYKLAGVPPYSSSTFLADASRQMVVVRLQDYWGQFVRKMIVLSAGGGVMTLKGKNVSSGHGFVDTAAVEQWLVQHRSGKRDHDWHVSQVSVKLATRLGISNVGNVSAALGSTTSPEVNVRVYRNFIVHRNQDTASRLRSNILNQGLRPQFLHTLPDEFVTGGRNLFDTWVSDFQLVAKVASS